MPQNAKTTPQRIIVVASTFPASDNDSVPAFVKDQVEAMHQVDPSLEYHVLAPHVAGKTISTTKHRSFIEHRFHYALPRRFETLTAQGILPALKQQPLYYLLIPGLFIGEFVALLRLVRTLKPTYLYAHWFTPQAIVASWVSRITGVPFVFTTHAADVDVWHRLPGLGALIVRRTTRRACAITAVSSRSLSKLEAFFTPTQWRAIEPRTRIIPMGTHHVNTTSTPASHYKQAYGYDDEPIIFFMGRLAEKKGVRYLLEAFEQLQTASAQLVIAGDGPLRAQLEQQAASLSMRDRVHFVGYLSGATKAEYIAMSDVVVLPSIITDDGDAEGLPVVFMEALAAGKLTVATNESGADTIITDTKSGFLLPHKNSHQLAQKIDYALNLSPKQATTIQAEARRTSQQFDWPTIAAKHLDFLFPGR